MHVHTHTHTHTRIHTHTHAYTLTHTHKLLLLGPWFKQDESLALGDVVCGPFDQGHH